MLGGVGSPSVVVVVCLIVVLGCANSKKQRVFVSSFGRRNDSVGNGHNTAQTPATLLLIVTGGQSVYVGSFGERMWC